jgi:hypothetical protein
MNKILFRVCKNVFLPMGLSTKGLMFGLSLLLSLCWHHTIKAQIIYAIAINSNGDKAIFKIDLNNCGAACQITPFSPNIAGADLVLLPGGNHLHIDDNGIRRLEPPPSVQIVWQTGNPLQYQSGQLAPNGLVYLAGAAGLATLNPANNVITFIGAWPSNIVQVWDIYYIDGVLYGTAVDDNSNTVIIQINTNDPSQSTIVGPFGGPTDGEGGVWNGVPGLIFADASHTIYFYNPQDGTTITICDIDTNYSIISLSSPPAGLPEYPCISTCTTNAGTLPQAGPFNICVNSTLSFPPATGTVLDANDLLRYILFSNPADTAGSIIATSSTPSFTFNPATMQTGVTYYIAAMAGNGVNGNVDLNDPCLDFSNALQVVWRPLPSITFSVANPNVCTGGCTSVTATFTGTAPFTLTYTTPGTGPQTQTFSANTGTFQVCVPAGAPAGSFQIAATKVVDAWCTCE